jgi:hypothetical protein
MNLEDLSAKDLAELEAAFLRLAEHRKAKASEKTMSAVSDQELIA